MASQVFTDFPNHKRAAFSASSTVWQLIATDGTGYATFAALYADGKFPFPNLDPGARLNGGLQITADNGSGGGNSEMFYAVNVATAPSTADAYSPIPAGGGIHEDGNVQAVWVRKSVGTDVAYLHGTF